MQHKKEHQLHCDIKEGDNIFYFTTCGWMMWNWLVSALASKASIVLFDGSPMYKKEDLLLRIADKENKRFIVDKLKWNGNAKKSGFEMGDYISELKIENANRPSKIIVYPLAIFLLLVFGYLNSRRTSLPSRP